MITEEKINVEELLKPAKKTRNQLKAMLIYWLTILATITILVLIILYS